MFDAQPGTIHGHGFKGVTATQFTAFLVISNETAVSSRFFPVRAFDCGISPLELFLLAAAGGPLTPYCRTFVPRWFSGWLPMG
jgi:hypothetical protein